MSPTPSRRQQILEAAVTRLAAITLADGAYFTDAGATLFTGEAPLLGDSDPPHALAVLISEDSPRIAGPGFLVAGTLEVHAIANATLDDPWSVIEQLLADVKRAMELADRTFEGLVIDCTRGQARPLPRQEGSLTVGVSIEYQLQWKEGWGLP